ncbi:hypothetical protein, partial [Streptococcus suis]
SSYFDTISITVNSSATDATFRVSIPVFCDTTSIRVPLGISTPPTKSPLPAPRMENSRAPHLVSNEVLVRVILSFL